MSETQYVLLTPAAGQYQPAQGNSFGRLLGFVAGAMIAGFLVIGALATWNWLNANLFNWGINDTRITRFNDAELLERIRAFEVVSLKHTYAASAEVDVDKALKAGPARVSLPGWVAGQEMKVDGKVTLAAGVDLSRIGAEDVSVVRNGRDVQVIIAVPEPRVLSAELVPNTLDVDTSQGVLTRLKTRLGFNEKDLRDQAADQLVISAHRAAIENGLLAEAAVEVEARLESFLNGLPQFGSDRVVYDIQLRAQPLD